MPDKLGYPVDVRDYHAIADAYRCPKDVQMKCLLRARAAVRQAFFIPADVDPGHEGMVARTSYSMMLTVLYPGRKEG